MIAMTRRGALASALATGLAISGPDAAQPSGWTVVSMKNDWGAVFVCAESVRWR